MATKTITVTEDAYNSLRNLKWENESFSHLFKRLSKERGVAEKYFGILKGDINEARKRLKLSRNKFSKDLTKRQNVFFRH